MKKGIAILLCVLFLVVAFVGCSSSTKAPSKEPAQNKEDQAGQNDGAAEQPKQEGDKTELKGEFTWWTYFDQAEYLKQKFEEAYPNIKINLQKFGGDEYQTKLLTTLQSGQGVPDVFDLEEGYVYKFIESDLIADLDELGLREAVADYYEWAVAMGTDSKGRLKGICDNVSPVAFWYLRDAMEKWVGTSDPDQLAEKFSTWDNIIAIARDVKEKSGGQVYLWPNLAEIVKVEGYSLTPFVRDGKFNIEQGWYDVIALMRRFYDEKLIADLPSWSGEWASAWNEGKLLIRVMPSWDFFTDWEKNSGNVGVTKPPKSSYEGGTYRSIYAKSDKKELCVEFLKFLTTVDYQIANLNDNNQMPANMKVFEKIGANYSSEKFGGQNILKTYDSICRDIPPIVPDMYTRGVQNIFQKHCEQGIKQGLTDEQIIENFKKEVKDKYPEISGL